VGIPKVVFVTGSWPQGSVDRGQKLDELALERGTVLHYFDDEQRDASAQNISDILESVGVVSSAYRAFTSLRPIAYKADLWRYMILWDQGGIYLDVNIQLQQDLATWVDFERDELVLVRDQEPGRFWNAMIASTPRHPALAVIIRSVVRQVLAHSYGDNDLDITGPQALSRALAQVRLSAPRINTRFLLREEVQGACGSYPNPPCRIRIYNPDDGMVLATKGRASHEVTHDHYSKLYKLHQVYCDEPGPPCA